MVDAYDIRVEAAAAERVLPVLIWARDVSISVGAPRPEMLDLLLSRAAHGERLFDDNVRHEVRAMLRHGAYKPSGRGKPASEYLLQSAALGEFPLVNTAVDANNAISLASGLPGSVFDSDLTGPRLLLRYGTAGESYVFNRSGQSIDLEDLLVVCRDVEGRWEPCGNPVKDAMETKIRDETANVVGVLYVPRPLGRAVAEEWASRYAGLLEESCRARCAGVCFAASD